MGEGGGYTIIHITPGVFFSIKKKNFKKQIFLSPRFFITIYIFFRGWEGFVRLLFSFFFSLGRAMTEEEKVKVNRGGDE